MMSSNEALEALEEHLEKSIENIRQIGIIVSDFQPQGQSVLNQVCFEDLCEFVFFSRDLQLFLLLENSDNYQRSSRN